MEAAVRQLGDVLGLSRNADVVLDQVVVRNEILVADRPVLAVAVERLAVQILFAQPVALAAPDVGASADDARAALPAERLVIGVGVGFLEIVGEPLVVPLAAGVAVALLRPRAADEVARLVAVLEVVGRNVLGEVFVALRLARFEQRDLDASLGQTAWPPSHRTLPTPPRSHRIRRLHVELQHSTLSRRSEPRGSGLRALIS